MLLFVFALSSCRLLPLLLTKIEFNYRVRLLHKLLVPIGVLIGARVICNENVKGKKVSQSCKKKLPVSSILHYGQWIPWNSLSILFSLAQPIAKQALPMHSIYLSSHWLNSSWHNKTPLVHLLAFTLVCRSPVVPAVCPWAWQSLANILIILYSPSMLMQKNSPACLRISPLEKGTAKFEIVVVE